MAYLDTQNLNEDFKTTAYNAISGYLGGFHAGNLKNNTFHNVIQTVIPLVFQGLLPINHLIHLGLKLVGGKDAMDKAYFERYWDISSIIPTIEKWCKKEEDALHASKKNKNITNRNTVSAKSFGDREHEVGNAHTHLANPSLFKKGALEKFTTALTCIPIKSGDGFYYIYPIFDSDDIRDIKVLCYKKGKGLFVKSLKQWKSVDHEQFKK
jgi:hypothetical protein